MKHFFYFFIFITALVQANAQMPLYHYVRVAISPTLTVKNAEQNGVDLESSTIKSGEWIETVLPESTIEQLRARGEKVDIIIDNLTAFYQARNSRQSLSKAAEITTPEHFKLGTMGGYFKLDEVYKNFEEMQKFYPEAVSEAFEIGRSVENRPLYAYRFSTSTNDDKPQVLYTAVHHAREPGGASTLIYFFWDLLEKAKAGDAEALYLLANRIIYVIPMVNPDGYMFNQTQSPTGGGLWRKNRHGNQSADINRNYGPMSMWDAPEGGSSTKPSDETFRGSEPFSEPETEAIRDFCNENKFRTALNYHTFGNLLIYPFGTTEQESADSAFFRSFSADGTKFSNYSAGVALQTVNYSTRGSADDWMYASETDKPKIFAMTPEVGSPLDGFYAPPERIVLHAADNLYMNYQLAWSALTNYRIVDASPLYDGEKDKPSFSVTFQNTGVEKPDSTIDVTLTSLDSRFKVTDGIRTFKMLSTGEKQTEVFDISAPNGYHNGDFAKIEVKWLQNGTLRHDTIQLQFYRPRVDTLYGHSQFTLSWKSSKWATVSNPEGGYMLSDSPTGNYEDSDSNYIQILDPIDIVKARRASLDFWARWTIEAKLDYGVVQVSDNDGRTWVNLQSSRMKPATGLPSSKQESGTFGFDGNFPAWVRQECNLDAYIGKKILVRFGVLSDDQGTHDGMFLKDISLRAYDDTMSGVGSEVVHTARLEAFPSPAKGLDAIYVVLSKDNAQLPQNTTYTVQMFNTLGEECYHSTGETSGGNEHQFSIPVANLASGVYRISMQFDGQVLSGSCVILK